MSYSSLGDFCEDVVGGHYINAPDYTGSRPGYCVPVDVQWTTPAAAQTASNRLQQVHMQRLHEAGEIELRERRRNPVEWAKASVFLMAVYWPVSLTVALGGGAWWLSRRKKR